MAPKLKVGEGLKKVSETAVIRSMKELMKDYELRCERYQTGAANSIRKQFAKALEDDRVVTRFLVDPQDRRVVEYWDDAKLARVFQGDPDDGLLKRKKARLKPMRDEKPMAKILPLVDAIRARRYTQIQEFMAGLISRGCYPISRVELVDCFLDVRSVSNIVTATAISKTLKELCLDFNELGEAGCKVLCAGLVKSRFLLILSLAFCGLTKQCGLWIGNLLVETAIKEIVLDGNPLESEGVIALLSQLAEAAENEGFDRIEDAKRQLQAVELSRAANRPKLDRDVGNSNANAASNASAGSNASASPNPSPAPSAGKASSNSRGKKKSKKSKKGKKRGKRGKKNEPPPKGPQISVLRLADTGINHMGRGGNFAPVRCMQLLKSMISHSKDLQEIDLFANDVGDLGARQILEGLLVRKDNKLQQMGIRMGHRINQDTFDIIHKLAPGAKKKGKGKK